MVLDDQVVLNPVGQIAESEWRRLEVRFSHVRLDEFIIMPNHIHGIILITTGRGAADRFKDEDAQYSELRPYNKSRTFQDNVDPGSLGALVRAYKSSVSLRFNRTRFGTGVPLWQRNYFEHIIRGDSEMERICRYIRSNPQRWSEDRENPTR